MRAPSVWIVTQLWRAGALSVLCLLPMLMAAQVARSVSPRDEQEIVRLVNQERQSRGLATLVVDQHLVEAARIHSQRMADTGQVEHVLDGEPRVSERLTGVRFNSSGENVALNQDAARAHDALMHSPRHKANILDSDYNTIGVGVIRTAKGIYVTEDFAHRLPQVGVDEAEQQIANGVNRLRHEAGTPELTRVAAPSLRGRACGMATQNRLDPQAGMLSNKVSNSVVFTASDLTQLPSSLQQLRRQPASGFSVGACYQSSAGYERPVFWFIVVTYF